MKNKNIFKALALCLVTTASFAQVQKAQTLQVGNTSTAVNASAALEVNSTSKGLLIPRMSTTDRTGITTPATGLQVYDTTTNSNWYYNGTAWVQSATGTAKFVDGTTPADAVFTGGNVGIGTTTPTSKFNVVSSNVVSNYDFPVTIQNTNTSATLTRVLILGTGQADIGIKSSNSSSGLYIGTDATGANGVINFSTPFATAGDLLIKSNDLSPSNPNAFAICIKYNNFVGFGTKTPQATLDVNGAIKIGTTAATPVAGMIRFNGTNFQGYNGTAWVQLNN